MAAGLIQFVPSAGGPATQTFIADGEYEFTDENGPVEGEQVVTITRTLQREEVPPGTPKKDADFIPETGFKTPMPTAGWMLQFTVTPDHDVSKPADFDVDQAVAATAPGVRREKP